MKKRLLSFLLSLTMVMSLSSGMTVMAIAADGADTQTIADLTKDAGVSVKVDENGLVTFDAVDDEYIYVMSATPVSIVEMIGHTTESYIEAMTGDIGKDVVDAAKLDLETDYRVIKTAVENGYTLMIEGEEVESLTETVIPSDSVVVVYKMHPENMSTKTFASVEQNPYRHDRAEAYVYAVHGIYADVVEYKPAVSDGEDVCPIHGFADVSAARWYYDGVHYCLENGLMVGVKDDLFAPSAMTTRAQLVTILWRLEGKPMVENAEGFNDVYETNWYNNAVLWATENDIVSGYGDGHFGPSDIVSREQMVSILWRYAQYKGIDVSAGEDTNILSYDDAFDISEYAVPAMQWACGSDVVNGREGLNGIMILDPQGGTTRAQMAVMMKGFCENIVK